MRCIRIDSDCLLFERDSFDTKPWAKFVEWKSLGISELQKCGYIVCENAGNDVYQFLYGTCNSKCFRC